MDIDQMEWPLSKEELEYLYWDEGIILKEIGDFFNKTRCGVSYWMNKYNIKIRYSKTTKQFKKEVYELVGNEYKVLGNYKKSKIKTKIKHNKCNHIYKVTPSDFIQGARCPKCAAEKIGNLKRKNLKEFKEEVQKLGNGKYKVLGKYKNNKTKIRIKHKECGYEYKVTPANFLTGRRCPNCFGNFKKTDKKFKKEVYNAVKNEYIFLEKYINDYTKIKVKHNKCGHIYMVTPGHFLRGRRCPKCSSFGSSIGEKNINKFLKKKKIKSKLEFKFKGCKNERSLRFDFKIKEKPIVIEYNGKQHYEPVEHFGGKERFEQQKQHDRIKKDFCKENNIKLITIPYWEKDNIEEILEEELKEVM